MTGPRRSLSDCSCGECGGAGDECCPAGDGTGCAATYAFAWSIGGVTYPWSSSAALDVNAENCTANIDPADPGYAARTCCCAGLGDCDGWPWCSTAGGAPACGCEVPDCDPADPVPCCEALGYDQLCGWTWGFTGVSMTLAADGCSTKISLMLKGSPVGCGPLGTYHHYLFEVSKPGVQNCFSCTSADAVRTYTTATNGTCVNGCETDPENLPITWSIS